MTHVIQSNTMRTESSAKNASASCSLQEPEAGTQERFEKALSGDDRRGASEQGDNGNPQSDDTPDAQVLPSSDALFKSLFESKMATTTATDAAQAPSSADVNELVDTLAQRILTSDAKNGTLTASGAGKHKSDDISDAQVLPSSDALFKSLFESKMVTATSVAAPAPSSADVNELVDTLVQRILVSDPKSSAPAEIRIEINDSVLADTHIAISRSQDGMLNIQLLTSNASSMQTLVAGQYALAERLEKQGPVMVKVSSTNESGQGDNDANRRSQGLVEYDQDNN